MSPVSDASWGLVLGSAPSRPLQALEEAADLLRVQVSGSHLDCHIEPNLVDGEHMRWIGRIIYSKHFTFGSTIRVRVYQGATKSDRARIIQAGLLHMKSEPTGFGWDAGSLVKTGLPYKAIGLCRPLSSYEGEELVQVMEHPDLLEMEINSFLSTINPLPQSGE